MKKLNLVVLFLVLALTAAGCTQENVANMAKPDDAVLESFQVDIVRQHNLFGFDMYHTLLDSKDNMMISPVSISMALAMAYNGSDGATREAMAKVLHLEGISDEQINNNLLSLIYYLRTADPKVTLVTANSAWMREGFPFDESFIEAIRTYFLAEAKALDFQDTNAPNIINRWVKDKTQGLIPTIVDPPIDPQTILYLINAVYFKGEWTKPFDPNNTQDGTFTTTTGEAVTVPMMHQSGSFAYLENENVQGIRLPYGDDERMAIYIFLPGQGKTLTDLNGVFNEANWNQWKEQMAVGSGTIQLPKFTMEYKQSLVAALKTLGMDVAFDPDNADFSRLVSGDLVENIFISEVLHKTYINVNETGTEAAAVTSVEMNATSMPSWDFEMAVDRPFIYVIEDNDTGAILFMGNVINPVG